MRTDFNDPTKPLPDYCVDEEDAIDIISERHEDLVYELEKRIASSLYAVLCVSVLTLLHVIILGELCVKHKPRETSI